MNFLLANFWSSQWFLIILIVLLVVVMVVMSFTRKKKDDEYRKSLNEQIVKGAHIKTYGGLYGTVVSVTETTDGKVVLVETGEGDKVSYQQLHINAIFGLDDKQIVTLDEYGNVVDPNAKAEPEVKVQEEKTKKAPSANSANKAPTKKSSAKKNTK